MVSTYSQFFLIILRWDDIGLGAVGTGGLIVPALDHDNENDFEAITRMKVGKGNRVT
jgi:hypothetical protein